jgi:pilus assembly protein Flp/PilA
MERLWRVRDEAGQGLAEYALILALIAIAVLLAITFLGGAVLDLFNSIGTTIDNAT